jgi:circadian clock protein KaiC
MARVQHESAGRVSPPDTVQSGIAGLDEILSGGFPRDRLHLVQGAPGTGKTTLALQFLLSGARQGERVLYVTLAESIEELHGVARSHGWDLAGVALQELAPSQESLRPEEQYTILHPAEVELSETIGSILDEVARIRPTRVVVDSLAELQFLARDPLRYHRQILGLKQFFTGYRCTVLLLDGPNEAGNGVESIAHSVLHLYQIAPEYGVERRRMRVVKMRGARYRGGYHDFVITTGGLHVFPRLIAAEHNASFPRTRISSGVAAVDQLLGGGLDRGTSTLLVGPSGVGKSVLATQFAVAAAGRGEQASIYVFDENVHTFLSRSAGLGLGLDDPGATGRVRVQHLDPAQLSPGEFDHLVRHAVEHHQARLVVIDSLNGYLNAMAEERSVVVQLHELLSYLGQQGVVALLTVAQHGLVGEAISAPLDVSYLADTVVLLRYFEAAGQLRQAISVVKHRTGAHERTIRELHLGPGVRVGPPVQEFQGVLAGSPTYLGSVRAWLPDDEPE